MSIENTPSFEVAYQRLEEILERMNSGKASLDEALKLYEEADQLISSCNKKLSDAEKKIEMLVKTREGELLLDPQGRPQTQEFLPPSHAPLSRTPEGRSR